MTSRSALAATPVVEINHSSSQCNQVTLRVKVIDDDNNEPIGGLNRREFTITTTDGKGNLQTVKPKEILKFGSLEKSEPDPAYVVLMLDMSASMKRVDLANKKKFTEAINATKELIQEINSLPVKVALIPYGAGGGNCPGYNINLGDIDRQFSATDNRQLETSLDQLKQEEEKLCAATNIYDPLGQVVEHLAKLDITQFPLVSNPNNNVNQSPKLAVILLSDGYDSVPSTDENGQDRYSKLTDILKKYPNVTVHTMGYGETNKQLVDRAICRLNNQPITVENIIRQCQLTGEDITRFIVDEKRLNEIAKIGGGIYRLPGNAKEVVDTFTTFLKSLQVYELSYRQPGADRASRHETTVKVNAPDRNIEATSKPKTIEISNFNYCRLAPEKRLNIMAFVLGMALLGFLLFIWWSKKLKSQADY